jgi:hypothetical protein
VTATPFLLRAVLLQAYPLAAFFAVVRFFPFEITSPLDRVDNPLSYMVVWTALGLLVGFGRWRAARQAL